MDLTTSIRLKIDVLRRSKIARYNALSESIESELRILNERNAEIFAKLEDALEADVLGKPDDLDGLKRIKEGLEKDEIVNEQEYEETVGVDESRIREGYHDQAPGAQAPVPPAATEPEYEDYYDENGRDYYYRRSGRYDPVIEAKQNPVVVKQGTPSPPQTSHKRDDTATTTATPNDVPTAPVQVTNNLPSISEAKVESPVSYLRSRAQETQRLLAEKQQSLTQLKQKHELAMKRLDKLQSDLENVSEKWEAEERARIQSESKTVLGKRKRDDDEVDHARWKTWGLKGIEWSLLVGLGIASAVGANKFHQHG